MRFAVVNLKSFSFGGGVFQFCPIWIQLLQLYQSVKFSLALKKVPLSISFFCSTFPLTLFIIICSHNFENIIIFDTIHLSVSKRLLVAWSETLVIQLLIYIELQNSSLQHHMAQLSKRLVCCIKCKTHSLHFNFSLVARELLRD